MDKENALRQMSYILDEIMDGNNNDEYNEELQMLLEKIDDLLLKALSLT